MKRTLICLGLALGAVLAAGAEVGPVAPWGSSAVFQRSVLATEQEMSAGRFREAAVIVDRLPRLTLTISWDDSLLPANRKVDAKAALTSAIAEWTDNLPGMSIKIAEKGDIRVSFAKSLPAGASSAGPSGAVFFESDSPADPRVETVIALARTEQKITATSRDIRNEIVYAIGRFMGLESTPRLGGAMDRTDEPTRLDSRVSPNNTRLVFQVFDTVTKLRKLIATKTKVEPAIPKIFVDTKSLTRMDGVTQGDMVAFSLSVTNNGNAPLQAMVIPDCSCFAVQSNSVIAPGQTVRVGVQMDTREFPGLQHKNLVLFSNDLDQSVVTIPVAVRVQPRYRIVQQIDEPVTIADERGWAKDLLFWSSGPSPLVPKTVTIDGVAASVEWAEWTGTAADPFMGEALLPRKGYRIRILGTPSLPDGRVYANIFIETGDQVWGRIGYSFALQRGIAAFPFVANFGRIQRGPAVTSVLLSRPGKPFRVIKIDASHPFLSASPEPAKANGDIAITVRLDGSAPLGDLDATITVTTNDPKQSTIVIPVSAVIQ